MPDQVDPGMLRPAIERRLRKKVPGANGRPTLSSGDQGTSAGDMVKKTVANKKKAYPGLK